MNEAGPAQPLTAIRTLLADGIVVWPRTDLPAYKGAYALILRLDSALEARFGKSAGRLEAGWYVYTGSAYGPGGTGARLARHFRRDKRPHWHIDQLSLRAADLSAVIVPDGSECAVAATLSGSGHFAHVLAGFGSSDCPTCSSHLLRWSG